MSFGSRKPISTCVKRNYPLAVFSLVVFWLLPLHSAPAQSHHEYTSDYFSFVGRDEKGLVAFAMDNNRGRAADRYQAEHFVKLYDQLQGWVTVKGNGDYPNDRKQLKRIPDSADFSFTGTAEKGLIIRSLSNAIELSIPPISKTIHNQNDEGAYWLGAAAATLRLKERVIRGRLIYEYLHWNRFNRLAGKSPGRLRNFNGFYLIAAPGSDFYLHDRDYDRLDLTGKQAGFATWTGAAPLDSIELHVTDHSVAAGVYLWPNAWTGRFRYNGSAYRFTLKTVDRDTARNWVVGGFAMAIVKGEIQSIDGFQRLPVVGLAELIM